MELKLFNSKLFDKNNSLKKFNNHIIFFISLFFGLLYTSHLLRNNIFPTNDEWLLLGGDMTQHYLGWLFFRFDDWHWPLTVTDQILYPFQTSIAYTDSIPLWAIFFKLFSSILPFNFQYFGLFLFFNFTLQFFFGAKLISLFKSSNYFIVIMSGILFMIAPPLRFRVGHIALTSHWLILASIWSYFSLIKTQKIKKILALQFILILISSGIHPYLAVMVFLIIIASYLQLYIDNKFNLKQGLLFFLIALSLLLIGWNFFGYFSINNSVKSSGFGFYSTNLNSLFNPLTTSLFIKSLPVRDGQYEGFNYLGLGILLLSLITFFKWLLSFKNKVFINIKIWSIIVLTFLCVIFALSNQIYWGNQHIITIGIPDSLKNIFQVFRSSGRFIWVFHYLLLLGIIYASFKVWKRQQLYFILPIIICLQFIDFVPHHQPIGQLQGYNNPLQSQEWQELSLEHNKLISLPPSQCDNSKFPIFERLAVQQKMQTNSMWVARYESEALDFHCNQHVHLLAKNKFEEDASYVLDKKINFNLYNEINLDELHSHYCSEIDGFILCRKRSSTSEIKPINIQAKPYSLNTILYFQENSNNSLDYQWGSWSSPGKDGTWTNGTEAHLLMSLEEPLKNDLTLYIEAVPFIQEKHPQQIVDVLVNEELITKLIFNKDEPLVNEYQIPLSAKLVNSLSPLKITFRFSNLASPRSIALSDDHRLLGLEFKKIKLVEKKSQ